MQSLIKHIKQYDHVIWDWNGTLLDDGQLCYSILLEQFEAHSLPPVPIEITRKHFQFPLTQYYRALGFDLDKICFNKISDQFYESYQKKVMSCRLFEGTQELLTELSEKGISSAVLTAAEESTAERLISHFGIRHYFQEVYGLDHSLADSKVKRGHQLMDQLNWDRSRIVLIGDTDHDAQVAQSLGIEVILLADGHQCHSRWDGLDVEHFICRYSSQ